MRHGTQNADSFLFGVPKSFNLTAWDLHVLNVGSSNVAAYNVNFSKMLEEDLA